MQLYVKWLGYGDEDNSWISRKDNQELAALDTYLANNPDVAVPVFKKKKFRPMKKTALEARQQPTATLPVKLSTNASTEASETLIYNYIPPKCISKKRVDGL